MSAMLDITRAVGESSAELDGAQTRYGVVPNLCKKHAKHAKLLVSEFSEHCLNLNFSSVFTCTCKACESFASVHVN